MIRNLISSQPQPTTPPRIPPSNRRTHHGELSPPSSFSNVDDGSTPNQDPSLSGTGFCRHTKRPSQVVCWCEYPQSLFPEWTCRLQKKNRMKKVLDTLGECSLHYLDIMQDGAFVNSGIREVNVGTQDRHWAAIQHEMPSGVKTRLIFVQDLKGPVLQMLGTRYNIDPIFFSSSIGWTFSCIRSKYETQQGDHMMITLRFIRPIQNSLGLLNLSYSSLDLAGEGAHTVKFAQIDTQAPLFLHSSERVIVTELLALYMVRSPQSSTIISYHPTAQHHTTLAAYMRARIHSTGHSLHWSRIFKERDPTYVILTFLWYATYAWDEALNRLYEHICFLESRVIVTAERSLIQEMHMIHAHLFHYKLLLCDLKETVLFVQATPSSFQVHERHTILERQFNNQVLEGECKCLLDELERLENSRESYGQRVNNVIRLVYNLVCITDSRYQRQMIEATMLASMSMKQISYLLMGFLPGTFIAIAFGMNVGILKPDSHATLGQYFALAVPVTVLTMLFFLIKMLH